MGLAFYGALPQTLRGNDSLDLSWGIDLLLYAFCFACVLGGSKCSRIFRGGFWWGCGFFVGHLRKHLAFF